LYLSSVKKLIETTLYGETVILSMLLPKYKLFDENFKEIKLLKKTLYNFENDVPTE